MPEARNTRGYEDFIRSVADDMGLGDRVRRPGTTVVAADARSGSAMVVAYSIEEHTVLWCDPAIAEDLAELTDPVLSKSHEEIGAWADRAGWERVSVACMQLLGAKGVIRPAAPIDVELRSLDRDRTDDVTLIDAFKGALSEDDRDEADLDNERLDEHIKAVIDQCGIAAFASQQPFIYAEAFGDIAVATRPDVRGRGLGRIAVAALCEEIEARGMFALYRCETTNPGSVKLSASLGFVRVVELFACKKP